MDEETDWLKIDDITWHGIFEYLDGKSLMNASETCSRFANILSGSKKLLGKLKVQLKFPELELSDEISQIESRLATKLGPLRTYQHLEIIRLRDVYLNSSEKFRTNFFSFISKLSPAATSLVIQHCQILRKDLVKLMRPFGKLAECQFVNLVLHDDVAPADVNVNISCPDLRKLLFKHCDFFCLLFFKSHEKLESLTILEPQFVRTDVEELENFLLKQERLKELNLFNFRFNSTYSTNRLARVPFQLEHLSLNNVHWDIAEHCEIFLRSQKRLKTFELRSFNRMVTGENFQSFSRMMQHILTNNPQLSSFATDTKCGTHAIIKDEDFLIDVVNNQVTELTYNKGRDDKSELLKIFTRIFPKVKRFSFSDGSDDSKSILPLIQSFKDLESLDIRLAPKSLSDFQIQSSKLKTFKYCSTNEDKSVEKLSEIIARNLSITQVALNIEPLTVEEITELLLPLAQSLESLSISDLHLNLDEADMIAKNFPKLRKVRSDFKLNPAVINILSSAQIMFEHVREEFLFRHLEETE